MGSKQNSPSMKITIIKCSWSEQRDKIIIGEQTLDYTREKMYRDGFKFDGIHMYGSNGRQYYTKNVLNVLRNVFSLDAPGVSATSTPLRQNQAGNSQTQNSGN